MADPRILLFTNQFPYGAGEQFLETEIVELAKYSNDITIFPAKLGEDKRPLPANVALEVSYAKFIGQKSFGRGLWLLLHFVFVIKGLIYNRLFLLKGDAIKRIIKFVYISSRTKAWIKSYHKEPIVPRVMYTYWFESTTHGLARYCQPFIEYKVKTRAHGQDLYQERHVPPFFPFRKESVRLVDNIFLVSQHGLDYLTKKYPFGRPKFQVSPLAVSDPGFLTSPSRDGVLRIVSCAFMVEVKRLDLLFDGIIALALQHPQKKIVWHHIGDGPLLEFLQDTIDRECPVNLKCRLLGALANQEVLDFYRQNPTDVFINVSRSEGVPVSIMEAFSCGIPAIATAVGGTAEIVNPQNGILLSHNPEPTEIAVALNQCFTEKFKEKRENSRLFWKEHYLANRNYRSFYQKLVT